MKVLGINASPHGAKSLTLKLVKAVLGGVQASGLDVEFVDLCALKIEYCNACGVCYKTGNCPRADDFYFIYEKMLGAAGLVIGSPNYIRSVSAQLKTLLDRMADAIHCQLLTGKYSVNVATSGGLGKDLQVTEYLSEVMLSFGAFVTGSVGASIAAGPEALAEAEKKAFHLGEVLAEDIKKGKKYPDQELILEENRKYFQNLVRMNKDEWVHEYEYWKSAAKAS
ncbi:MAG: Iron-sulfur flavoprotein [Syntrophus sp. PtaB.Bin001]|nr:MAG: Iron-sulfur flavoprotein [Syntrophus sp. PtaB.Bin001]